MKVITSGSSYLDIDAYAGCIAYAELLNLTGYSSKSVSTAPLNESITETIRGWDIGLDSYTPCDADEFVLVDVSNYSYLDPVVDVSRVVEVIDHHPGFERFWRERLGNGACIERIGASCTQILERWVSAQRLQDMRPRTAQLLMTGILDNTLNFQANVTTKRDRIAYEMLAPIALAGDDWTTRYFSECQSGIESDLCTAIRNDAKTMMPTRYLPSVLGQLVLWDGRKVLKNRREEISAAMGCIGEDWLLNLVSICEGKSYFLFDSEATRKKVSEMLSGVSVNGVMAYDRLLLRKELMLLSTITEHGVAGV